MTTIVLELHLRLACSRFHQRYSERFGAYRHHQYTCKSLEQSKVFPASHHHGSSRLRFSSARHLSRICNEKYRSSLVEYNQKSGLQESVSTIGKILVFIADDVCLRLLRRKGRCACYRWLSRCYCVMMKFTGCTRCRWSSRSLMIMIMTAW